MVCFLANCELTMTKRDWKAVLFALHRSPVVLHRQVLCITSLGGAHCLASCTLPTIIACLTSSQKLAEIWILAVMHFIFAFSAATIYLKIHNVL